MGNASTALKVAAGLFLTIALITIVVLMFIQAQEATKNTQETFTNIQTELSQTAYTVFDGTTVSGSQVLNALRKYSTKDQFGVLVVTGKNPIGSWYNKIVNISVPVGSSNYGSINGDAPGKLTTTQDESKNEYINPSGKFRSQVVIDNSGVVRGLVFKQQ